MMREIVVEFGGEWWRRLDLERWSSRERSYSTYRDNHRLHKLRLDGNATKTKVGLEGTVQDKEYGARSGCAELYNSARFEFDWQLFSVARSSHLSRLSCAWNRLLAVVHYSPLVLLL